MSHRTAAPTHEWAHIDDDVFKLIAWCGDNVARCVGEPPETDNALKANALAVENLRATRDAKTLKAWLASLRDAETPADVLAVFAPDSARTGESAPALACGV